MALENQERFLVDPISGFVGRIDDTNQYTAILEPAFLKGEAWPIEIFIARNPDSICVSCHDADDLAVVTRRLKSNAMALDFCTLLLDPEVRVETKKRIAVELEGLFTDEATFSHVADILFAAPLQASADVSVLYDDWFGGKVGHFLQELFDSQTRIRDLFSVWAGMKSDLLVQSVGHEVLTGRLISKSFFRTLINSGETQDEVDQIEEMITIQLKEVCDQRILLTVISEYKKTLYPGTRKQQVSASEDLLGDVIHLLPSRRNQDPRIRQIFLHTVKKASVITSLYAAGKNSEADDILSELLRLDLEGHTDFVVELLYSMASRASASGQHDVSLRLLQKALEDSERLNAVFVYQIGTIFREIGEFDKARDCYRKAKLLEDCIKTARIRDATISNTSLQGGE